MSVRVSEEGPLRTTGRGNMKALTSRERLDRCFRRLESDRPGLFVRGVTKKLPAHPSYAPLRELVLKRCDLKFRWDCRYLIEPPRTTRHSEPLEDGRLRHITILHTPSGNLRSTVLTGPHGESPEREEYLLKTVEDANKFLSQPAPRIKGDIVPFFDLEAKAGDRGIVEIPLGLNPAAGVVELFGAAYFALFSLEHRSILLALMKQRMEHLLDVVEFLSTREVGCYFALTGQSAVLPPLYSAADFADFSVQFDKPIADRIHEAGGILHVHCPGSMKEVLPLFLELGADVLHPIEAPPHGDISPREAKGILRGKTCIEGNISGEALSGASSSIIRDSVHLLIESAFDDRTGLVVCPTHSPANSPMTERSFKNYRAMIETTLNWK